MDQVCQNFGMGISRLKSQYVNHAVVGFGELIYLHLASRKEVLPEKISAR